MAPGSSSLLDLPEPVLEVVFSRLDQNERVSVLPLVCKAFHRLLAGPNACLWCDLSFEADISAPPQLDRASSFLGWLARHGQRSKTMQLELWNGGHAPHGGEALAALGVKLEDTLAVSLVSCEFLRLRWGGQQLVVGDWVATATALTCLALSAHELTVRGALSSVSNLLHLELSTLSDGGPQLEAGCLPPSITRLCSVPAPAPGLEGAPGHAAGATSLIPDQLLALPRLAYLDVSESWFSGPHLQAALPRLTRLTSLAFDKCELPDGMPPQLSLLTAMRVLSFDGCIVPDGDMQPEASWAVLSRLTRLVSLSISNCSLMELPQSILTLPRLQHLYAEHNSIRFLPPGPFWRALHVFSTDWEPLLRSHHLLRQAPMLRKLALGNMAVSLHSVEDLPPLAPVEAVLESVQSHPSLIEVLLVVRPAHVLGAMAPVLEVLLRLRGLRHDLDVRPIEHDAFFVEEPPAEEQEEEQQAHANAPPQPQQQLLQ